MGIALMQELQLRGRVQARLELAVAATESGLLLGNGRELLVITAFTATPIIDNRNPHACKTRTGNAEPPQTLSGWSEWRSMNSHSGYAPKGYESQTRQSAGRSVAWFRRVDP